MQRGFRCLVFNFCWLVTVWECSGAVVHICYYFSFGTFAPPNNVLLVLPSRRGLSHHDREHMKSCSVDFQVSAAWSSSTAPPSQPQLRMVPERWSLLYNALSFWSHSVSNCVLFGSYIAIVHMLYSAIGQPAAAQSSSTAVTTAVCIQLPTWTARLHLASQSRKWVSSLQNC